jgi:hypothetical protein
LGIFDDTVMVEKINGKGLCDVVLTKINGLLSAVIKKASW